MRRSRATRAGTFGTGHVKELPAVTYFQYGPTRRNTVTPSLA